MPNDAPHTYAAWASALERFAGGEDAVLEAMRSGAVSWTSVVAERWTGRVIGALNTRLNELARRLQLALDRAAGDPTAVSTAMLSARRSLQTLRDFAALPCLPNDVADFLAGEIERWARQTQEGLERQMDHGRHDQGRLLKAFRDQALTSAAPARAAPPSTPPDPTGRPSAFRRILI